MIFDIVGIVFVVVVVVVAVVSLPISVFFFAEYLVPLVRHMINQRCASWQQLPKKVVDESTAMQRMVSSKNMQDLSIRKSPSLKRKPSSIGKCLSSSSYWGF